MIFPALWSGNFLQVKLLSPKRPSPRRAVVCVLGLLLATGTAAAQVIPSTGSLPNAPEPEPRGLTGINGAPEYSNAAPQVKQSIEDQSDDQESPAFALGPPHPRPLLDLRPIQLHLSGPCAIPFALSGPNSFHAYGRGAVSRSLTVYTGLRLLRFTELIANFDEAGGSGLSDGLGRRLCQCGCRRSP